MTLQPVKSVVPDISCCPVCGLGLSKFVSGRNPGLLTHCSMWTIVLSLDDSSLSAEGVAALLRDLTYSFSDIINCSVCLNFCLSIVETCFSWPTFTARSSFSFLSSSRSTSRLWFSSRTFSNLPTIAEHWKQFIKMFRGKRIFYKTSLLRIQEFLNPLFKYTLLQWNFTKDFLPL